MLLMQLSSTISMCNFILYCNKMYEWLSNRHIYQTLINIFSFYLKHCNDQHIKYPRPLSSTSCILCLQRENFLAHFKAGNSLFLNGPPKTNHKRGRAAVPLHRYRLQQVRVTSRRIFSHPASCDDFFFGFCHTNKTSRGYGKD